MKPVYEIVKCTDYKLEDYYSRLNSVKTICEYFYHNHRIKMYSIMNPCFNSSNNLYLHSTNKTTYLKLYETKK